MPNSSAFGVELVAGSAILALMVCCYIHRETSSPPAEMPVAHQEAAAPKPVTSARPELRPATPVSFTARMPTRNGINIVQSNGQYNLNAVHIAVPDQFHHVRLLPGTDPAAAKYLADSEAQHASVWDDSGAADVDPNSVPAQNMATSQRKRVAVRGSPN